MSTIGIVICYVAFLSLLLGLYLLLEKRWKKAIILAGVAVILFYIAGIMSGHSTLACFFGNRLFY